MRRARIKAVAAVPLRKKPVQDMLTSEISNISNTEQKKDISDAPEQEIIKNTSEIEIQKKDLLNIDIIEQKAKDFQEEVIENKQTEARLINLDVVPKKSDSQESASLEKVKRDSQKICTKLSFQESCIEIQSDFKESCKEKEKDQVRKSSQELFSQKKLDSQETCSETKLSSLELCNQENNPKKLINYTVQEKIRDVSIEADKGTLYSM